MTAVTRISGQHSHPAMAPDEIARRSRDLAQAARAGNTRRAYRSDWTHYEGWCRDYGLDPLPAAPVTVGMYVAAHAEALAVATLIRRVSAIATIHRMAGHGLDTRHPAIHEVMTSLRRTKGVAPRQARALTTPLLRKLLATCGTRLIDVRDRALLLVGFAGAFRRSELVALQIEDVRIEPEGLRITIRRSKGDQEGEGEVVAVMRTTSVTCPVAAYESWITAAGITHGRVFRAVDRHRRIASKLSGNAVAALVQRRAALAGLDAGVFSGHSMRAGFATAAAAAGVEERLIMRQTRHRSATVLRRYIRDGELFTRNLAKEVGL